MRRWTPFAIGLAASIALTVLLWSLGVWGFAFFLFLPLLFWPRRRRMPACSQCGYRARGPEERYCPRDGSMLLSGMS